MLVSVSEHIILSQSFSVRCASVRRQRDASSLAV